VRESRDRVQAAFAALGLSLPPKRITVNLAPADTPKEGSHYDLPIALALLGAMGVIDGETLASFVVVGELGLDGRVSASPGVLLAAMHASATGRGLVCPAAQGPEAAWLAAGPRPGKAASRWSRRPTCWRWCSTSKACGRWNRRCRHG
jgi:magnesium chelatase family protein